jgi:hypothetical protein
VRIRHALRVIILFLLNCTRNICLLFINIFLKWKYIWMPKNRSKFILTFMFYLKKKHVTFAYRSQNIVHEWFPFHTDMHTKRSSMGLFGQHLIIRIEEFKRYNRFHLTLSSSLFFFLNPNIIQLTCIFFWRSFEQIN